MPLLIGAVLLLIGTIVQAVQAIAAYRRTFSSEIQSLAERQGQRADDLNAVLEDRISDEIARAAYLDAIGQDIAAFWGEVAPLVLGAENTPSLEAYAAGHQDDVRVRAETMQSEFAPFHQAAQTKHQRLMDRAAAQRAALNDLLTNLPGRAATYRRERRNIAFGWLILATGAAVNVAAAVQAM